MAFRFNPVSRGFIVLSCLTSALFGCVNRTHAQARPEAPQDFQDMIRYLLEATPAPGLAMALVVADSTLLEAGYGVADITTGAPVRPSSLFQIGSISKAFTATLGALMAENGRIDWRHSLDRYLQTDRLPHPVPTLGQLASHRSGLPRDPPTLRRKHGDYPVLAFSHFELWQSLARTHLESAPGAAWHYSNFGYAALGHALEIAGDSPWEVLLTDELLTPLGMASTVATLWPEFDARLTQPHWLVDGQLEPYLAHWDEEALAPAGGLTSTVEDLARFLSWTLRQLQSGRGAITDLVEPRSVVGTMHYGRGWFVETLPGVGRVVSVGGDVDGYVAELVLAVDQGLGTVILVNSGDAPFLPHLGRWILSTTVARRSANEVAQAGAAYRVGMMHQAVRSWAEARHQFDAARQAHDPVLRANALYQIGRTAALSGLGLNDGIEALEAYLESPLASPPAAALWRLGQIHEHNSDCREAMRSYERALQEDPNYGPALQALEMIRAEPCERMTGVDPS